MWYKRLLNVVFILFFNKQKKGNPNMCMTIYNSLNYNMMGMCMDKFGCRVV